MVRVSPFRRAVAAYLTTDQPSLLQSWTDEVWAEHFHWLDRSGLALPLAVHLLDSNDASRISQAVALALSTRLNDNQLRMAAMLEFFAGIEERLSKSQITFCTLKGFSLIPECYETIRERHQVDFDILIEISDAERAVAALKPLGYEPANARSSGEIRLRRPWQNSLNARSWIYSVSEGPAVELHTRLWEPETDLVDFAISQGAMACIETRIIQGVSIPRLTQAWQFVSLMLHVFRHLVDSWARLISLYEISVYIRREHHNHALWESVRQIIGDDSRIAAAFALVLSMVQAVFPVSLPGGMGDLCARHLSTESALWIEHFGDRWLFADPPGTKLSLLVQRQFCEREDAWRKYVLRRLFPPKTPHRLSDDASRDVRRSIHYSLEEALYRLGRIGYHVRSNWECLWAFSHWVRLSRSSEKNALPEIGERIRVDEHRA